MRLWVILFVTTQTFSFCFKVGISKCATSKKSLLVCVFWVIVSTKQQLFVKDHWYYLATKALYFIHIGIFVHLKFATIEGFLVSSWEHFDFSRFFKQGTRNESLDKNDQVVFMKFIGNQHMPIYVYINFLTFHNFLIQDL